MSRILLVASEQASVVLAALGGAVAGGAPSGACPVSASAGPRVGSGVKGRL